jgi:hypothetical protein
VEIAGVGIRRLRVTALPPEVTEQIRNTLSKYADVKRLPKKYDSKYTDFVSKLEYDW